jgi:hypothetical protein
VNTSDLVTLLRLLPVHGAGNPGLSAHGVNTYPHLPFPKNTTDGEAGQGEPTCPSKPRVAQGTEAQAPLVKPIRISNSIGAGGSVIMRNWTKPFDTDVITGSCIMLRMVGAQ